jgi:hypothetical protein
VVGGGTSQPKSVHLQITLDRYSHVIESMQTEAADAIGQFLTS